MYLYAYCWANILHFCWCAIFFNEKNVLRLIKWVKINETNHDFLLLKYLLLNRM